MPLITIWFKNGFIILETDNFFNLRAECAAIFHRGSIMDRDVSFNSCEDLTKRLVLAFFLPKSEEEAFFACVRTSFEGDICAEEADHFLGSFKLAVGEWDEYVRPLNEGASDSSGADRSICSPNTIIGFVNDSRSFGTFLSIWETCIRPHLPCACITAENKSPAGFMRKVHSVGETADSAEGLKFPSLWLFEDVSPEGHPEFAEMCHLFVPEVPFSTVNPTDDQLPVSVDLQRFAVGSHGSTEEHNRIIQSVQQLEMCNLLFKCGAIEYYPSNSTDANISFSLPQVECEVRVPLKSKNDEFEDQNSYYSTQNENDDENYYGKMNKVYRTIDFIYKVPILDTLLQRCIGTSEFTETVRSALCSSKGISFVASGEDKSCDNVRDGYDVARTIRVVMRCGEASTLVPFDPANPPSAKELYASVRQGLAEKLREAADAVASLECAYLCKDNTSLGLNTSYSACNAGQETNMHINDAVGVLNALKSCQDDKETCIVLSALLPSFKENQTQDLIFESQNCHYDANCINASPEKADEAVNATCRQTTSDEECLNVVPQLGTSHLECAEHLTPYGISGSPPGMWPGGITENRVFTGVDIEDDEDVRLLARAVHKTGNEYTIFLTVESRDRADKAALAHPNSFFFGETPARLKNPLLVNQTEVQELHGVTLCKNDHIPVVEFNDAARSRYLSYDRVD